MELTISNRSCAVRSQLLTAFVLQTSSWPEAVSACDQYIQYISGSIQTVAFLSRLWFVRLRSHDSPPEKKTTSISLSVPTSGERNICNQLQLLLILFSNSQCYNCVRDKLLFFTTKSFLCPLRTQAQCAWVVTWYVFSGSLVWTRIKTDIWSQNICLYRNCLSVRTQFLNVTVIYFIWKFVIWIDVQWLDTWVPMHKGHFIDFAH